MRKAIAMAAIVTFAAGTALAQEAAPPSELGADHAPAVSEPTPLPATPPTTAAPTRPDAAPVVNSEEPAAVKIESEEQAKAKFESEGFTEVSQLKQNDRGTWTAMAMKDGRAVQLSMNSEGQIALIN
jgi:periplasmic protein CpxP/Spy